LPDLIEVAEADARIASLVQPAAIECVPLTEATGRVLREPVVADRDLPPFDRVMMDGYAIRYADWRANAVFHIRGTALAGSPRTRLPDEDGRPAFEVMTGAPLPEGADTVIPFEDALRDGDTFRVTDPEVEASQFIHRQGSDFSKGTPLLSPGVRLRSVEIGIAASCGCATLPVSKRPVVAIFGTGDELVPVDTTPAAHQIRRSNAQVIASALENAGATVATTGHLSDAIEREQARLEQAIADSEIVVISGAVSKGRLDWIPGFLDEIGECIFHGVRQRPGKPMGVWRTRRGAVIFALPGNPVSTLACTHRTVVPFIAACSGCPVPTVNVRLLEPFSFDRPLTLLLPVKREVSGCVSPAPVNNSGDYASLAGTDGFIELPSTENHWTAGTVARFTAWS
jgi:molybdopterin molybdotransferase